VQGIIKGEAITPTELGQSLGGRDQSEVIGKNLLL
jgi:hypothetical protein